MIIKRGRTILREIINSNRAVSKTLAYSCLGHLLLHVGEFCNFLAYERSCGDVLVYVIDSEAMVKPTEYYQDLCFLDRAYSVQSDESSSSISSLSALGDCGSAQLVLVSLLLQEVAFRPVLFTAQGIKFVVAFRGFIF